MPYDSTQWGSLVSLSLCVHVYQRYDGRSRLQHLLFALTVTAYVQTTLLPVAPWAELIRAIAPTAREDVQTHTRGVRKCRHAPECERSGSAKRGRHPMMRHCASVRAPNHSLLSWSIRGDGVTERRALATEVRASTATRVTGHTDKLAG